MAIQVHKEKLERQLEGIERWRRSELYGASASGNGTFWYATGVGKTFSACIIINKLLEKNPASTIVIVVPGPVLENQWKNEIKTLVSRSHDKIEIHTIEKIVLNTYRIECTLLILDEVHEYLTENRIEVVNGDLISARFKLGLTATWLDKSERQKSIEKYIPVVDRIDEIEAEEKGFISKSIEYNIGVELTEAEREEYKKHSEIINRQMVKFGKGKPLELASKVIKGDGKNKPFAYAMAIAQANGWHRGMDLSIESNQHIYDLWNPKKITGYACQLMDAIRERKNILYCAQNKLYIAKQLFFKFDTLKTIFFSQSTNFADRLAYIINEYNKQETKSDKKICVSYHSRIQTEIRVDKVTGKEKKFGKKKLMDEAINGLKDGTFRGISASSALDKGLNIRDIRLGITTSGTQNPTQYFQRKGRTVRVDIEEDIIKLVINVYAKNTKDEEWLRNRQKKVKSIVYWCDNINDVNYTPKREDTFNLNEF